jgi:hypothetical protein
VALMAYTQADIDELRARIKAFGGVKQTTFADQSTSFDLDAALRLLKKMEHEVSGGTSSTRYAATSKDV